MGIGAHDPAISETGRSDQAARSIVHGEQMIAAHLLSEGGVVKFVPAKFQREGQGTLVFQPAITQRQLAGGKARRMRKKCCHGMGFALGIDEIAAENHKAAALPVDQRAASGSMAEAIEKA